MIRNNVQNNVCVIRILKKQGINVTFVISCLWIRTVSLCLPVSPIGPCGPGAPASPVDPFSPGIPGKPSKPYEIHKIRGHGVDNDFPQSAVWAYVFDFRQIWANFRGLLTLSPNFPSSPFNPSKPGNPLSPFKPGGPCKPWGQTGLGQSGGKAVRIDNYSNSSTCRCSTNLVITILQCGKITFAHFYLTDFKVWSEDTYSILWRKIISCSYLQRAIYRRRMGRLRHRTN